MWEKGGGGVCVRVSVCLMCVTCVRHVQSTTDTGAVYSIYIYAVHSFVLLAPAMCTGQCHTIVSSYYVVQYMKPKSV